MKSLLVGAAFVLALPSLSYADDAPECPKPGTRIAFNNRLPVEIVGQEGFVCLVKGADNKGGTQVFRMLLGMSSYSAWAENHVERLFPFKVGNEVDFTSTGDSSHIAANLTETQTLYYKDEVKVLRQERIDTKMGSFNTWVIEDRQYTQGRISGTWVTTYWWAPELGYTVKRTYEVRAGLGTNETLEITSLLSVGSIPSATEPAPCYPGMKFGVYDDCSGNAQPAATSASTPPPAPAAKSAPPAPAAKAAPAPKPPAAVSTTPPASNSSSSTASVEDRLNAVKDLYDRKVITREEYEAKRKEILKSL
jgi:hypothetical protein